KDHWRKLLFEHLERRQLLTATDDWYDAVSPDWFQSVPGALASASLPSDASSSGWIVRLDESMARTVGDSSHSWLAFNQPTVVAPGARAPWSEFRVITGLGLPGQILVQTDAPADQAAADLAALPHVVSVEQQRWLSSSQTTTPNDPSFKDGSQYGLNTI